MRNKCQKFHYGQMPPPLARLTLVPMLPSKHRNGGGSGGLTAQGGRRGKKELSPQRQAPAPETEAWSAQNPRRLEVHWPLPEGGRRQLEE